MCQFLCSFKDVSTVWLKSVFVNDNGPDEFQHRGAVRYINMLMSRDTGHGGYTINVSLRIIFFRRCPAVNYAIKGIETMLGMIVVQNNHHGPYAILSADELAERLVCPL